MKNKLLLLILLVFSTFLFSQTSQELDKAMLSKDPNVIAEFIKKYPNNPNANFLTNRMKNLGAVQSPKAKPVIQPLNTEKLSKEVERKVEKGTADANTDKTVNLLNNLFSTDRNKSEVFVMVKNNSDCNLIIKVDGKKFFNLDVPKRGDNYLLVPKGTYKITTRICDANYYQSTKNLTEDTQIVLGISEKGKK